MLLTSQRNLAAAATPVPAVAQSTDRCTRRSRASSAESGLHKISSKIRCGRLFKISQSHTEKRRRGNHTIVKNSSRFTDWILLLIVPAFFFLWKLAAFGL